MFHFDIKFYMNYCQMLMIVKNQIGSSASEVLLNIDQINFSLNLLNVKLFREACLCWFASDLLA